MLTPKSFQEFSKRYYSELVLVSLIFLFFLELISDFVEAIYALCLLTLSLNENLFSVIFLFSPVLLVFFRKRSPGKLLIVVGELMIVCRVLEALLVGIPQGKMLVAGVGVGCFLVFFPVFLQRKYRYDEEYGGLTLGLGLGIGLSLSVLFRTLGSTVDISTFGWFQTIGWILAIIAAFMIIGMFVSDHEAELGDSLDLEHPTNHWKTIGLAFGLISILILIYFSFSSPTVISRWTEGDYFLVLLVISLLIILSVILLTLKPELLTKIDPWMIWAWNGLFILALVLTIAFNQLTFSASANNYPIDAPTTTLVHQLQLFLMLLLFPIILIDFVLISRELIKSKPSIGKLCISFTLGSTFFLIMIFAHVFTTVYDYIDVVGPLFRDMFWFVYLVLGLGFTLPVLLVKKGSLMFKKPIIGVQSKIVVIVVIIMSIGTVFGAFVTTPFPTDPETATTIRVMTYNIQQGYSEDGIKNFDGQLIVIKSVNPDIIGLQECDSSRIAGGNADVVRYFANALQMHSYYGPKTVTGTFGIALLSKYPIQNPRTFFMYSKGEQTATIEAEILVENRLFNVYVTHLGNGGPLVQQEAIMGEVNAKSNVVLIGDFNFEPSEPQYNLTIDTLNDSWLLADSSDIDYKDDMEYNVSERIDHIFVSPGMTLSECQYIVSKESDHPALWAEIEL